MRLLDVEATGIDFVYRWPNGEEAIYPQWIAYRAVDANGEVHRVRLGFRTNPSVYGRARKRVVVWIDNHARAGFLGADDFDSTGDLLCEITVPGTEGRICRCPEDPVPESYSGLPVVGLRTRVGGPGVHHAWAVVANIGDHRVMVALAALRHQERSG
jgi:hypothetical protein